MSDAAAAIPDRAAAANLSPALFEQGRRRKDKDPVLSIAIRGFGPAGEHTLFLPSPSPQVGLVFVNGKPSRRVSQSVLGVPHIAELRDRVIASFTTEGPGLLGVDSEFLEYVAAVCLINYDLDDADLTFLLAGSGYHRAMVAHLLGGADTAAALRELAPRLAPQPRRQDSPPFMPSAWSPVSIPVMDPPPADVDPIVDPAPAAVPFWRRVICRRKRR